MNRKTSLYTASAHTASYPPEVLDNFRAWAEVKGLTIQDSHIEDHYVSIGVRFPDDQTAVETFATLMETLESKHMFISTGLGVHRRDVTVFAR